MRSLLSPFLAIAKTQLLIVGQRPMNLATGIIFPWLFLSLMTFHRLHHMDEHHVVMAFTSALTGAFWAASVWSTGGIIRREQWMGMLRTSFLSERSPLFIFTAKSFAAALYDIALITIASLVFIVGFQLPFRVANPVLFLLGLLSIFIGGLAASMLLGSAVFLSRHAFYITAAAGPPLLLLGGFVIPPELLPLPVRWLSLFVNLRWLRSFLLSTNLSPDWLALAIGLLITLVYFFVAAWAIRVMIHRAKVVGTLEL